MRRIACARSAFAVGAVFLPLLATQLRPSAPSPPLRTLARGDTPDGHRFRLVQYRAGDFYVTQLRHVYPDSAESAYLLRVGEHRHESGRLCIAARGRRTVVSVDDGPPITVWWQRGGACDHFLPQPSGADGG